MEYLIVGGGIHAKRYTEALLFQSDKNTLSVCCKQDARCYKEILSFGVPIIDDSDISHIAKQADRIILADFPDDRLRSIKMLSELPNRIDFIIEKPSSLCSKDEYILQKYLKGKRYLIAYSRFFLDDIKKEVLFASRDSTDIRIEWPNYFNSIFAMTNCLTSGDMRLIQENHRLNSSINQILFPIYEKKSTNTN